MFCNSKIVSVFVSFSFSFQDCCLECYCIVTLEDDILSGNIPWQLKGERLSSLRYEMKGSKENDVVYEITASS